jgi:sulfur relay (sulfurtransferase) DsrC/TusE family protein
LARRDVLKGRINLIKNIVTKFGRLQDVRVLAQWGTPDEVRVNNVFHWHGETKESIPSREMGLLPSDEWKVLGSLALYYKEHNINPAELNSILQSMQELGLAALVKTNAGQIEAIQTGISDNESGLLFLPPEASKPKVHEHVPNGREYVYLEELEPGVFYYETT